MYVAVYPLYALLSFVAFGPFGVVSAFFTVLQYSNMILNFLISVVLMPGARDVVFDAVLSREGQDYVVFQEKLRRKHKKLWKVKITTVKTFLFCKLPEIILLELLILLVGIIPVIGPCLVLLIRAPCKGRSLHGRYYKLKGWDKQQIKEFDSMNRGYYTGLGGAALLLEMIPFLTLLTMFTNTIGAALWTIQLESNGDALVQVHSVNTTEPSRYAALVTGAEFRSQQEAGVLV